MDLKPAFGAFAKTIDKHAPTILTGLGLVGLGVTMYFTATRVPKAKEIIEQKKQDLADTAPDDNETKRQVKKEMIFEVVPVVAPIVISAALTGACIVGSNHLNLKREAALTTAYIAADQSLREWKAAAKETLEKKDYEKVEEKVRDDRIKEAIDSPLPPVQTGYGNYLCVDGPTRQPFYSNIDKINSVVAAYNKRLQSEGFISWNDFRSDLRLPPSSLGQELGFNMGDEIYVQYSTIFDEDANAPVLYLEYRVYPFHNLGDF